MHYDMIIIGSGSIGAAAGCYATHSGLKVLMIDSHLPPHKQGSHHGETRLMRHAYGEGEKYVPLLLRAQTLWKALEDICGEKLFHRTGVLNLGPDDSEFIASIKRSAENYALPLDILDQKAIIARWPQISLPTNYTGLFEKDAGVLQSERAISAWIRLAKQGGAAQLFNCAVTAISHHNDGVTVKTAEGNYHGRKLLVCTGTWVTRLLPALPITPVRKIFSWHQADGRYSEENHFPAFSVQAPDGEYYYGFPAQDNELKLGKHTGGQPINAPEQRLPFGGIADDGNEVFGFLRQFLPGIGGCLHGRACTYDNSPDGDFIIDTLPEHDNTLVITGLSGHGFKFAPVLGEIACQFAQNIPATFDLSPFVLARFK